MPNGFQTPTPIKPRPAVPTGGRPAGTPGVPPAPSFLPSGGVRPFSPALRVTRPPEEALMRHVAEQRAAMPAAPTPPGMPVPGSRMAGEAPGGAVPTPTPPPPSFKATGPARAEEEPGAPPMQIKQQLPVVSSVAMKREEGPDAGALAEAYKRSIAALGKPAPSPVLTTKAKAPGPPKAPGGGYALEPSEAAVGEAKARAEGKETAEATKATEPEVAEDVAARSKKGGLTYYENYGVHSDEEVTEEGAQRMKAKKAAVDKASADLKAAEAGGNAAEIADAKQKLAKVAGMSADDYATFEKEGQAALDKKKAEAAAAKPTGEPSAEAKDAHGLAAGNSAAMAKKYGLDADPTFVEHVRNGAQVYSSLVAAGLSEEDARKYTALYLKGKIGKGASGSMAYVAGPMGKEIDEAGIMGAVIQTARDVKGKYGWDGAARSLGEGHPTAELGSISGLDEKSKAAIGIYGMKSAAAAGAPAAGAAPGAAPAAKSEATPGGAAATAAPAGPYSKEYNENPTPDSTHYQPWSDGDMKAKVRQGSAEADKTRDRYAQVLMHRMAMRGASSDEIQAALSDLQLNVENWKANLAIGLNMQNKMVGLQTYMQVLNGAASEYAQSQNIAAQKEMLAQQQAFQREMATTQAQLAMYMQKLNQPGLGPIWGKLLGMLAGGTAAAFIPGLGVPLGAAIAGGAMMGGGAGEIGGALIGG